MAVRLGAVGTVPRLAGSGKRTIGSAQAGPLTHTRSVSPRSLPSLFALEGAALGLLMPFPVPLLDERGLGATQIGLILGLAGLASLAAYPAWGAIADAWLGRPRTIALASVAAAAGGLWLLLAGSDPLALAASLSLAFVGVLALGPLTDALTLTELGEGSSAYGRVRLYASAGWALAAALPAVAEIPVFGASRGLVDRLGLRALFVSGAAIAALLMALVAVAPEPWMVTLLRSLDGVPYALRYTAMVLIIGLLLPRRLHATGQSVAWLVYAGIAPIAADVAGGLVYDTFGAPVLFLLTTAALGLGGTVAWLSLRGTRFGRVSRAQVAEAVPPPPM